MWNIGNKNAIKCSMKIVVFCKKNVKMFYFIVILMIAFSITYFIFQKSEVCAVEINQHSMIWGDFSEKIKNLMFRKEKIAYLTFDDGPNKIVTPDVLDILKEQDVKATFFVIGKQVEEHPEIVKREYEEGHYIANHGYSHDNKKLYKSEQDFVEEVKKTDSAIGKAIGQENYCSHVFRFLNGYIAKQNKKEKQKAAKLLEQLNYSYADWNCLNHDSMKKYSNRQLFENLKKSSKNKDTLVILMHDTKDVSNSSLVLKDSIEYLKTQGYTFHNFYDFVGNK